MCCVNAEPYIAPTTKQDSRQLTSTPQEDQQAV